MGGSVVQRRDRVLYKGDIAVTLVSGPQTVTFPAPMPNDYDIYIAVPQTGLLVTSITSKTQNGFTLNFSITLAGSMTWVAVEKMS